MQGFRPFEILDVLEGHGDSVAFVVFVADRQGLAGQAEPSLTLVLAVVPAQMLLKLLLIKKVYRVI